MNLFYILRGLAQLFAPHKIYLVGGSVRDYILGRPYNDIDIATDAHPEVSERILREWGDEFWDPGAAFGTVCAKKGDIEVQVTTFRSDCYTRGDRHPKVVWGTNIETDLMRRDFTINALAMRIDPNSYKPSWFGNPRRSGCWVGPIVGYDDLARKILRTPIDPKVSFTDDPLRLIRAARFQAQLPDFTVAEETLQGMMWCKSEIHSVANERIVAELDKMLLAPSPFKGALLLDVSGVGAEILPEAMADPILNIVKPDLDLRWATWLFNARPSDAREALRRLRHNSHICTRVPRLLFLAQTILRYNDHGVDAYTARRFVVLAKENRNDALHLAEVVKGHETDIMWYIREMLPWEQYTPKSSGDDVMRHFGIGPSKEVGTILNTIQEAIYTFGPFTSSKAELQWIQEH